MGVNLDNFAPYPSVDGKGSHGGYCGPAVKPIALNMVSAIAKDAGSAFPFRASAASRLGSDAVEFMVLGAASVQVCTAVMHYGYRIVEDMIDGLGNWMDEKGFKKCTDFIGKALPNIKDWSDLNLNYKLVARIDSEPCIGCELCHVAAWDGSHQCIDLEMGNGHRGPWSTIPNASAAICACWSVPSMIASRWRKFPPGRSRCPGGSTRRSLVRTRSASRRFTLT